MSAPDGHYFRFPYHRTPLPSPDNYCPREQTSLVSGRNFITSETRCLSLSSPCGPRGNDLPSVHNCGSWRKSDIWRDDNSKCRNGNKKEQRKDKLFDRLDCVYIFEMMTTFSDLTRMRTDTLACTCAVCTNLIIFIC